MQGYITEEWTSIPRSTFELVMCNLHIILDQIVKIAHQFCKRCAKKHQTCDY